MKYEKMISADEYKSKLLSNNYEMLLKSISDKMKELDFFRIIYLEQKCDITGQISDFEEVFGEIDLDRMKEALNIHAYGMELHDTEDPKVQGTRLVYICLSEEKRLTYAELLEKRVNDAIKKFNDTANTHANVDLKIKLSFDSRIVANQFYNIAKDNGYEVEIVPVAKTKFHPVTGYDVTVKLY